MRRIFCTAEAVGGLYYDGAKKKWEGDSFKATEKFVLRLKLLRARVQKNILNEANAIVDYEVSVTRAGTNVASPCSFNGKTEIAVEYEFIECETSPWRYMFNLNNNRFLEAYMAGFVSGRDNSDDTPSTSGGTCTKIE